MSTITTTLQHPRGWSPPARTRNSSAPCVTMSRRRFRPQRPHPRELLVHHPPPILFAVVIAPRGQEVASQQGSMTRRKWPCAR